METVLAVLTLVVAIVAILGAYLGQNTLNEHARNLSLAIQDANRVIEQIRQDTATSACALNVVPPGGGSWNAWLGAGKSIQPNPAVNERIVVTCQDQAGAYCGANQGGDFNVAAGATSFDPIRVTVAVCWRHRNRTIGECAWDPNTNTLTPADSATTGTVGVIESPAMLTTLVTCRG